ncbi:hypothetical protein F4821DRAFT_265755 [Hypoxylon rubiginosum]|uniref:Uncharacterized protein n=1 Tax=Hypoxylon rubiginosum TaxID=110542 RepID=A0ACC0CJH5_9PEZI|nr:hypothetical protein F4821DRAFT_265755 [Hypoxylon rubiginosum]
MQFKSITLALVGATSLMAHPFAEQAASDLVELDRKPASDGKGTLLFLGLGGEEKRADAGLLPVEERATCQSSATPSCSGKNTARNDICDQLVSELYGDASVSVGQSPRQICYQGAAAESNDYCCVSWHDKVPGLTKGDLAPFAQGILSQCTSNGISGKTYNVLVHNTCTSVCLSNRGTGC